MKNPGWIYKNFRCNPPPSLSPPICVPLTRFFCSRWRK